MSEASIAEIGMSQYGLRRMHLVQGGKTPVDLEAALRLAENEGARREDIAYLAFEDEDTGIQHLWLWWRLGMIDYPMYGWGFTPAGGVEACGQAVLLAAKSYQRRYGAWPNRAAVRDGMQAPEWVDLRGENGPIERIELVKVGWIQPGMVGVFRAEEATGGGAG